MNGKEIRLERIFGKQRNLLLVAVDHGEFMGPIPGTENLKEATKKLKEADAILFSPGMLIHCIDNFNLSKSPYLACRLNWNSNYCFPWKYNQSITKSVISVEEAVRVGADMVLASLALRTGNEAVDAANVTGFSQFVREKEKLGIPLIGEFYPSNIDTMNRKEFHETIKIGCRVVAELGADIIKTFYTGNHFNEIVRCTPVPILVLGAEKTPREIDALRLAELAIKSGARGIAFGRNIIQAKNPENIIKALRNILTGKTSSEEAAKNHHLK